MIPKSEKRDLDQYDLHLSEQLPKLFSEGEDGDGNYGGLFSEVGWWSY